MVNRSRRLRKKLHIDEFKELGFTINWSFTEGTDEATLEKVVDQFICEVIDPNGLAMVNHNRRLCKKLHIDEFKELGFTIDWSFTEGMDEATLDKVVDQFIREVIKPNCLAYYEGSSYLNWQGIICTQKIGNCTEEHRTLITSWLTSHGLTNVEASPLIDIWWDELVF